MQQLIFQFAGGLGIFLFAIQYMGEGLKKAAGDNLRNILNKFTSTPLRAVLAGIVVTILIQSSSGTTVLTVGLVSAGFMSLNQAIGVIMGANIGTTITAFIIGLDIGTYALPIMAVGTILLFFFKRPFLNNLGQTIFGFGGLFYGLELMGTGLEPLQAMPIFNELMLTFSSNRILGVIAGTLITVIMQSSSATTGIIQQLYSQGGITLGAALPLLFGSNIGTTITAIIASIGATLSARRTSAAHVIFNLIGTILTMLLFSPYLKIIQYLAATLNLNAEMQIAFAHGIFNIVAVLVLIWFIPQLANLVTRIIPGTEETLPDYESQMDRSLITSSPILALDQVKREIGTLGKFVAKEYKNTHQYYQSKDPKRYERIVKLEAIVDHIDISITEFLMHLSVEDLPENHSQDYSKMGEITKYLERIGDHTENIANIIYNLYQTYKDKKKKKDTDEDVLYHESLEELFELVDYNINQSIQAYLENDEAMAQEVIKRENQIDKKEQELRQLYMDNLNKGIGKPSDGVLFIDIVSNLERISDHTSKIAKHSLSVRYPFQIDNATVSNPTELAKS